MDDDWKRLALFAEVVRAGSLSAAARRLGISTSAVSQQLRVLEQAHGVTLLHRTTRKIAVTEAGARLADHCQAMVDAADRARQQLTLARDAPQGELRISAPVGFARHVAPALAPLLAAHPGLTLRLLVDDAMIDLVDARVDLALRAGRLADSTWVARRLCSFEMLLCAAPAYLARAGVPQAPADLLAHQWIGSGQALLLELSGATGTVERLRVEPRAMSNNQLSLQQLCVAGLGLTLAVRADVEDELRSGRLVPVLPGWRGPPIPVWAVTPQRDGQPAKVRHAAAAIERYLLTVPGAIVD
ncbi:LysR family transcriptional regulator [Aquincola tertiaricarbonis]|uniref:LysR family transcriptional regulator n=1 Tax=Aquincola tertiaricarbonis TaxID=391953 RepID=A0ABY4S0L6_AQUTE|nr:LysR family transcriptional regulator [Aquincola tertiaricarbonis]URI06349.1 LysR family transcriptional regulator [Aquincola tertiaricarbonis]